MKITGNSAGEDLIARMRSAALDGSEAADRSTVSTAGQDAPVQDAPKPTGTQSSPMHDRIKALVARELAASSTNATSAAQLRGEVIEIIVDARLGAALEPNDRRELEATLRQTLVDDPTFKQEVDMMLILAAEEVGRRA